MTHSTATPSGRGAAGGVSKASRFWKWLRSRSLFKFHASIGRFTLFAFRAGPVDYARAWAITVVVLECELQVAWELKR